MHQVRSAIGTSLFLVVASLAHADSVTQPQDSNWIFSSASTLNQGYEGWFFSGDSGFLYPALSTPGQPWTSAANLATMNAWLSLVNAAQGDPVALAALEGLGMTGSTTGSTTQSVPQAAPEAAFLALLCGGVLLLLICRAHVVTRRFG